MVYVDCNGDTMPCANNTYDLGSLSYYWKEAYISTVYAGTIYGVVAGSANITGAGTAGTIPEWTGTTALGNSPITHSLLTLDVDGHRISNVQNPSNNQDAATKLYVDNAVAGVSGSGNVTALGISSGNVPVATSTTGLTSSIITANATTAGVAGNLVPTGDIVMSATKTVDGYDVSLLGAASHTQGTDTSLGAVGTKNPPIDADKALYRDSTAGDALVTSTWTQIKAFLKAYFDGIYGAASGNVTTIGGTDGTIAKFTGSTSIANSTVTESDVSDAVTKKHTQNTDTTLTTNGVAALIQSGTLKQNLAVDSGITVDGVDLSALSTVGIMFLIDGGGSAITTGVKGDLEIPFSCNITKATALADQNGSIAVSIWKDTYSNYPPTAADNITSTNPIYISASNKVQDSVLSYWTKAVSVGDILRYNVDNCTTITRVTISLTVVR
jgi:hypothetical protein